MGSAPGSGCALRVKGLARTRGAARQFDGCCGWAEPSLTSGGIAMTHRMRQSRAWAAILERAGGSVRRMNINIIGGGPAGLYFAILMKKADPAHRIQIFERNGPDDTF